ncbi:hypothetical protein EUGRSUZ_G02916 [Eucalyptus grandis]|uniref:Uncharacterized protein n=2 Tax=Eucalyptus grandis TaxID=71139 RepID=A0ACC3K805_EUCGR|nr:hypothetical protein EUGRSUZ_G02916 [Eucalyptus grandis]
MPTEELLGKEPETGGFNPVLALDGLLLDRDIDLQDLRHVHAGLLGVLGHQGGVARRLRHLHPPVVGEGRWQRAEHQDYPPHVVCLGDGGSHVIMDERPRGVQSAEDGGDDDSDCPACEDPEPLHREHRRDETAPESEEAKGRHDGPRRAPQGEPGGDGTPHHEHKGDAVDALAAQLVPEPPEEELPCQGPAQGDPVHGGCCVWGQTTRLRGSGHVVIDPAEELGHQGDAEEVVRVGEEAHPGDHHRSEVVELSLGLVQRVEDLQLILRHGRSRLSLSLSLSSCSLLNDEAISAYEGFDVRMKGSTPMLSI